MNGDDTQPICPCGSQKLPWVVFNQSPRDSIAYRWGDYTSFRYAMLQALPGENVLTETVGELMHQVWRPTAEGDIALQLVEWWAYLADILTFYTERIANEGYLRTAALPESVNRLIKLLGYRPRPGLGARGTVAALLSGTKPVTLTRGFQIQSKPGPGRQPQVFELDVDTRVQSPDVVPADVSPTSAPLLGTNNDGSSYVWLAGKVSGIKKGDHLLLVNSQALSAHGKINSDYAWTVVSSASAQTDPLGNMVTQIDFNPAVNLLGNNPQASNYVLMRSNQSSPLWGYPDSPSVVTKVSSTITRIDLASIARSITPGTMMLLDVGAPSNSAASDFANAFSAGFNADVTNGFVAALFAGAVIFNADGFLAAFAAGFAAAFATAFAAGISTDFTAATTFAETFAIMEAIDAIVAFRTGGTFSVAESAPSAAAAGFAAAFNGNFSSDDAAAADAAFAPAFSASYKDRADYGSAFATAFSKSFAAVGRSLGSDFAASVGIFASAFADAFVANASGDITTAPTAAAARVVTLLQSPIPTPVIAQSYAEVVWYANGKGPTPPPSDSSPAPVAIPHAEVSFASLDASGVWAALWNLNAVNVTVLWGLSAVGQLVPVLAASDLAYHGGSTALVPAPGASAFPSTSAEVLIADPAGNAAEATTIPGGSLEGAITLTMESDSSMPSAGLASPIDVMFDLLPVSCGKTVPNEVLGSGNATVLGQDFTLEKAPVTYQQDTASTSGDDFSSTVQVWVNGIAWQEVRSFYGQSSNAQVFLTYEDERGDTHVLFNGRLPTGVNNVVATYRYGGGQEAPAPGTLTVVLQPQPGLKGIANPIAPSGGADPDPPTKIRKLAPRSVMTFNRSVSLDDYKVVAATAPGVARASAAFALDPLSQRPCINVWVGDDERALAPAQSAIAATCDPNKPVNVQLATALTMSLSLTYLRDPRYQDAAVQAALQAALIDPDRGLFGINNVAIGQVFYDSQIYAACLRIPGVAAVHNLSFSPRLLHPIAHSAPLPSLPRRSLFRLLPQLSKRQSSCTGEKYDPGPANFYVVPTVTLNPAIAR